MSRVDDLVSEAESLGPDDRLRLIARLWATLPPDHWAAPTAGELAEVRRRIGDYDAIRSGDPPWDVVRRMLFPESHAPQSKLYAATRRFDLATIFVAMAVYSLLFGLMTLLDFQPLTKLYFGAFILVVGVGQALLEPYVDARRASMYVGAAAHSLVSLFALLMFSHFVSVLSIFVVVVLNGLVLGAAMGYMAGVLVGGVFLIADALRGRLGASADDADAAHPAIEQGPFSPHPLDGPTLPHP